MQKAQQKRREELEKERLEEVDKIKSGRKGSFNISDIQLDIDSKLN